jgi:hypothetical protein
MRLVAEARNDKLVVAIKKIKIKKSMAQVKIGPSDVVQKCYR